MERGLRQVLSLLIGLPQVLTWRLETTLYYRVRRAFATSTTNHRRGRTLFVPRKWLHSCRPSPCVTTAIKENKLNPWSVLLGGVAVLSSNFTLSRDGDLHNLSWADCGKCRAESSSEIPTRHIFRDLRSVSQCPPHLFQSQFESSCKCTRFSPLISFWWCSSKMTKKYLPDLSTYISLEVPHIRNSTHAVALRVANCRTLLILSKARTPLNLGIYR